jgi:IS5 family transposase
MERVNAEPGFVDGVTADLGGPRTASLLVKLEAAVPWATLAEPVRKLYRNGVQGGRRPWSAVTMLKCLMLAKWFGLSDPQLEENLKDRLSFRRFVGLSLHDETPDETTFVVFRRRLREAQVHDELFDRTVAHLEGKGLLVREGTLVDATIIEAPRGKKREDGTSTRDEDASFTKKHGRTYHGYKGHIAADRSGVVTDYRFSTAKDHDSRYIDDLTFGEKKAVFGDSAYMDRKREADLARRGVLYGIVRRRRRGQKELPEIDVTINRMISSIRAIVEHPFAWLRGMGHRRTRYRGKDRNALDFAVMLMAYNFKRSLSLSPAR